MLGKVGPGTQLRKGLGGFFTYDDAGNLREQLAPGRTFGYDALERLVSVRQNGVLIARYGYDVAGRRIVKRVYSGATGGTVGYLRMVYAGNQVAFETDSANTSLSTIYTWGPGVDNLVGVQVGSTAYTVVTDALGSVRALVRRNDGAWVGRLRYDPYGQLLDSAGPQPALRYRWTGREWDAETGFYFHRSRYYDPAVGRFVQEDQVGYAGGGNLYAYVNGDVLQARDPDGLVKDATWAYLGWDAMCLGVDLCFGGAGELAPLSGGSSFGQRQAGGLMAWGTGSSWIYDLWEEYKANYKALRAKIGGNGTSDWVNGMFKESRYLEYGEFSVLITTVSNATLYSTYGGYSGRQVGDLFIQRLVEGKVFVNDAFIEAKYKDKDTRALTYSGVTVLHAERFFNPAMDAKRINLIVHEELHNLSPGDSECQIGRGANRLTNAYVRPRHC